jgi:hypothetical protein
LRGGMQCAHTHIYTRIQHDHYLKKLNRNSLI